MTEVLVFWSIGGPHLGAHPDSTLGAETFEDVTQVAIAIIVSVAGVGLGLALENTGRVVEHGTSEVGAEVPVPFLA